MARAEKRQKKKRCEQVAKEVLRFGQQKYELVQQSQKKALSSFASRGCRQNLLSWPGKELAQHPVISWLQNA